MVDLILAKASMNFVDGGARAHAHDVAGHHVLQRGFAYQGLEFVLGE